MGKRAHHPHRGSLGFSPRKRAASPVPKIKRWVAEDRVRMQGFAGYKAGMTHVVLIDDYPHSLTHGEEITRAVTVLEAPPLKVFGVRLYERRSEGLRTLGEVWAKELDRELSRRLRLPKKLEKGIDDLAAHLERAEQVRLLVHTVPKSTGIGKKKPEVMEYLVSGGVAEAFEYAKEKLGGEIRAGDVFEEGEFVDVMAVTKGKGFQSPVRRWGVKILHHKTRKGRRTAGTLGPWHPSAMMWSVPQSGQMGYHHRTDFNKRILKIGEKGEEVTPRGGFLGYGIVRGDYIILDGSVPGPRKRLVRLRPAIRPPVHLPEGKPQLTYISLESKQGV
ncbi:MAG: 50S ribosomal protein L3 [Euryarchaeota archaeon]|nr:50S ribosomal protein L3 [Euryarchaeota archaeon]